MQKGDPLLFLFLSPTFPNWFMALWPDRFCSPASEARPCRGILSPKGRIYPATWNRKLKPAFSRWCARSLPEGFLGSIYNRIWATLSASLGPTSHSPGPRMVGGLGFSKDRAQRCDWEERRPRGAGLGVGPSLAEESPHIISRGWTKGAPPEPATATVTTVAPSPGRVRVEKGSGPADSGLISAV